MCTGLLKNRRAPFIIAFNKIDRLYGWVPMPHLPVQQALQAQAQNVKVTADPTDSAAFAIESANKFLAKAPDQLFDDG